MCKNNPVTTDEYKGFTIEIYQDLSAGNPREEFDNLGKIVILDREWGLGQEAPINPHDFYKLEDLKKTLIEELHAAVILPLHYADLGSSGAHIQVTDYRANGYIFISHEDAIKEYGGKRITPKMRKTIESVFQGEIKEYNSWMNGEVYGFNIEGIDDGSVWGFYGLSYCLEEARDVVDFHIKYMNQKAWESWAAVPALAE